ncbi:MAG: hypothetical protein ACFFD2_10120 [Promethearchaeota archaeon]
MLLILIIVRNNGRELLKIISNNETTAGIAGNRASGDRGSPSIKGRVKEGGSQLPSGSCSSNSSRSIIILRKCIIPVSSINGHGQAV